MKRRAFLATTTALGAGLAGCLDTDSESDDQEGDGIGGGNDGDEDNGGSAGNDDAITARSITTTGSDCAGPNDDRAVADIAEDTVTITGTIEAPNPCHEAVLTSVDITDGYLSVTVDVESDLSDDEECVTCHGAVSYEATIELAEGVTVDSGTVEHATGEIHEFDAGDSDPSLGRAELQTTDASCLGAGQTDSADIEREGDAVVVTGGFTVPDPCHEATLDSATLEGATLQVTVGRQSTLDEGEVCQQCQGFLEYAARVEVRPIDALDAVRVKHPDGSTYSE